MLLAGGLSFTGCETSRSAADTTGGNSNFGIGNAPEQRTSSDMNISPSNLTTSDPAIKRQDTLTTPVTP